VRFQVIYDVATAPMMRAMSTGVLKMCAAYFSVDMTVNMTMATRLRMGARWLLTVVAQALVIACVVSTSAATAEPCLKTPPAVRDLALPRYYSDQDGSVVDPKLLAKHRALVKPLTDFLRHVTSEADKSIRRSQPASAAAASTCALQWLTSWAAQGAWLGTMAGQQDEYQRKWDLTGVALAYIKLRARATPEQRQIIESWLVRFADATIAFFDNRDRKRNNHWYWLGLGVGATALATDSERHWVVARGIMQDAASDIRDDGILPLELDRKARALHYHVFAMMPLIVLAELGASRGEDWYALSNGALHRLVGVTMKGLLDPDPFSTLAGEPQEIPVEPGAGWLQLYGWRFPERLVDNLPDVPLGHRWLGGDTTILAQTLKMAPLAK
jgi:poly(beta-D-mannuronate) lyase